jgi:hypothetical protein
MADVAQQPITKYLDGVVKPRPSLGATSLGATTPMPNAKAARKAEVGSHISPPAKRQAVMAKEKKLSAPSTIQDTVHAAMEFHALQGKTLGSQGFITPRFLFQWQSWTRHSFSGYENSRSSAAASEYSPQPTTLGLSTPSVLLTLRQSLFLDSRKNSRSSK